jgi:hypothetical protein
MEDSMAHKPDDKNGDKKHDTKAEHKADAPKSPLTHGDVRPVERRDTSPAGSTREVAREGEPPTTHPTVLSPTSDQLQYVVETHATIFSPDELSVLAAAVTELKDYEVLTAPPPPPVNRDVPAMWQEGPLLTCTMGNWEGEPTQYTYDWHRDGTFVVGGAASTYTVMTEDVGTTFTCVVTASNGSGATQAPPSVPCVVTEFVGTRAAKDPPPADPTPARAR